MPEQGEIDFFDLWTWQG